jgi:hypothetical protein
VVIKPIDKRNQVFVSSGMLSEVEQKEANEDNPVIKMEGITSRKLSFP